VYARTPEATTLVAAKVFPTEAAFEGGVRPKGASATT
jgi:hypothetical protein